jgi:hypothetical protein
LSYSQLEPAFGIKAGPNLRTGFISGEDKGTDKGGILLGFQIGGIVDLEMSDQVTLRTGLSILTKGTKIKEDDGNYFDLNPTYLEIPITFLFNASDLKIGGGPFIAMGISGKINDIDGFVEDIDFGGEENSDWTKFDIGLGIQASKRIDIIEVGIGLEFGFINTIPKAWRDDGYDYNISNFNINFTAAYMFNN